MKINTKKLKENLAAPGFKQAFETNPDQAIDNALDSAVQHPLNTDKWIYRMVVIVLGSSLLLMVYYLCQQLGEPDAKIPEVFNSIISAIVGAIAGLLAPSPVIAQNDTPQ